MIPGLRSSKRRIETSENTSFYNDFSNVIHFSDDSSSLALAINAGPANWTASPSNEAALVVPFNNTKALVMIDPVRKTRLFTTFSRVEITDFVFTDKHFALAASGLIICGRRADDGSVRIKGSRGIDRGVGFRLRIEDDGRLSFSKRGSCHRTFYDFEANKKESVFEPELLWHALYNESYEKGYIPPMPDSDWLSYKTILSLLRKGGDTHNLNYYGVRLYALVSALEKNTDDPVTTLEKMMAIDNEIQCKALISEPFPCHKMLQTVLGNPSISEMRSSNLSQMHILRYVRLFEEMSAAIKNTKLLNSDMFTDTCITV